MKIWHCKLTITNGRGMDETEVVRIAKNFEADSKVDAVVKLNTWAVELGLGLFMTRDDVRLSYDVGLGATWATGA